MLLLKLPQLGVDVKRASEIGLPLIILVPILGQLSESIKQLSTLVEQMNELGYNFLLILVHCRKVNLIAKQTQRVVVVVVAIYRRVVSIMISRMLFAVVVVVVVVNLVFIWRVIFVIVVVINI